MKLYYQVLRNGRSLGSGEIQTPFQIGRQNHLESDLVPVCVNERSGTRRLICAALGTDRNVPRSAIAIEESTSGFVIENIREPLKQNSITFDVNRIIQPGEKIAVNGKVSFFFDGGLLVTISSNLAELSEPLERAADEMFCSLAALATVFQPADGRQSPQLPELTQGEVVSLLRKALETFNEAPGSHRFYATIVKSVKEMIDVDRTIILVPMQNEWTELTSTQNVGDTLSDDPAHVPYRGPANYSRSLIKRVVESRQTEIVEPSNRTSPSLSMLNVKRAVASPIFDENRNVTAILYADKLVGAQHDRPISLLQGSLLDVIASAVSAGFMRQREAEFRTKAGQFFSKGVLARLSTQSDLLEGRDTNVSILACDIRGYSTVAHRAGPAETIKWINDVLTCLSECVLNHDGVVVDYIGDGLLAMFGAPEPQVDHADRACRAAREMLHLVPILNARYRDLVQDKFSIGIGVNTGQARVGNIGSRVKYKYGPIGSTVNMASRIEGITKQVCVPGLMTGSTQGALTSEPLSRRLSAVRVFGIPEPIQLFEIVLDVSQSNQELCERYEAALDCFERQEMSEALSLLASIVKKWPNDYPSQLLLKRTAGCFNQIEPFDPVWILSQK